MSDGGDANALRPLPPGWAWATIGEVCILVNGRAFKPDEWTDKGLPIIRIQNLNNPQAKFNFYGGSFDERHRVRTGDLLFAWSGTPGTSFGAHVWAGSEAILNQHIFNVREANVVTRRYLQCAMNHRLDELIGAAHGGAGLAHVTKPVLEATLIPIPPLTEQRRLTAKLDEIMSASRRARAALDAVPTMLDQYRRSVLAAAFRGEFTEGEDGGRGARWEWRPLRDCVEIGSGLTKNASQRASGQSVPLVTVAAVQRMRIIASGVSSINISKDEVDRAVLRPGDVLVVEGNGSRDNIGRVAIWNDEVPNARHQNHIFRLRPLLVSSKLLALWLDSPEGRNQLMERAVSASGLYTLSVSKLGSVQVPVPPIAEQQEIVRRVDAAFAKIEAVRAHVAEQREKLDALDRAILDKAFRGELVPQDPSDEPAAVMLERLRAERAAQGTGKKPRGRGKAARSPER